MICPHCHKDTELWPDSQVYHQKPCEQWFDAFWQLYPRKVAKASALKAWKKAATSEAIKDEIMARLTTQLPGWEKVRAGSGIGYIPHAATWLNGRRWEDEASLGSLSKNDKPRVIACDKCGDSGIRRNSFGLGRCSCPRGQLPGLAVPKWDADLPGSF